MMRVNLNQLRCFYLTAKARSVSKAAEALFVTPAAVTMQVKKLEKWLDVPLLVREGNRLKMTPDAGAIYAQAEKIFEEVDVLEVLIEDLVRTQRAEVTIGAHYIPAKYILPKLVARLQGLAPKLNVQVVLDSIPRLKERLYAKELHALLTASLPPSPRFTSFPLFSEEFPLVALKESRYFGKKKISIREVPGFPLLLQEHSMSIVYDYLKAGEVTPRVAMENISTDVIKQFIHQDRGGAFLMRVSVQEELKRGLFQEITVMEGLPVAHFSLVFIDAGSLSGNIRDLLSSLETISFSRDELV